MMSADLINKQVIIQELRRSLFNNEKIVSNKFHRRHNKAYVVKIRREMAMLKAVIRNLEEDRQPVGMVAIWQRWYTAWAIVYFQHYKRETLDYFHEVCALLRAERDSALAEMKKKEQAG